jgi:hypothetical protein
MLSLSAEKNDSSVNLQMINGDLSATEGDVEHTAELMSFAEAIARRDDETTLLPTRETLRQAAGDAVVVDTAAVAANFQRMVRIADSTGIPLDPPAAALSAGIRQELDLNRLQAADRAPSDTWKTRLLQPIIRPLARFILGRAKD